MSFVYWYVAVANKDVTRGRDSDGGKLQTCRTHIPMSPRIISCCDGYTTKQAVDTESNLMCTVSRE